MSGKILAKSLILLTLLLLSSTISFPPSLKEVIAPPSSAVSAALPKSAAAQQNQSNKWTGSFSGSSTATNYGITTQVEFSGQVAFAPPSISAPSFGNGSGQFSYSETGQGGSCLGSASTSFTFNFTVITLSATQWKFYYSGPFTPEFVNVTQPQSPPCPVSVRMIAFAAPLVLVNGSGGTGQYNYSGPGSNDTQNPGTLKLFSTLTVSGAALELTISGNVGSNQFCRTTGQVGALLDIPLTKCLAPHSLVALIKSGDLPTPAEPLSMSKPNFKVVTTTDDNANYEFSFQDSGPTPPEMVLVSTLWYDKNTFAITNGITDSSGTLVPLYIASCVAFSATPGCITWQSDGSGSYSAKVNFVYGNTTNDSPPFFSPERWQYSVDDLMADGIAAYYYSYKAINYYESLGLTTLNPVSVSVGVVNDRMCTRMDGDQAWYNGDPMAFGDIGQNSELGAVSGSGGSVKMCYVNSSPYFPDAPKNEEWHELSHYFMNQLGAYPQLSPTCCGVDHGGFRNPASDWGLVEGFAEFGSALISESSGDSSPFLYPIDSSVVNIQEDLKVWGIANVTLPCNPVCKFSYNSPPLYEELSIAGLLWSFHHGSGVCETSLSTVYEETCDNMQLPAKQVFEIFLHAAAGGNRIYDLHDLYNSVYSDEPTYEKEVNMTFINHGIYNNSLGDFIQGRGDPIGDTGDPVRHMRFDPRASLRSPMEQQSVNASQAWGSIALPDINGSYLKTSGAAGYDLLNISYVFSEPFSSYDFSYTLNVSSGQPFYLEMPPPYFPSEAIIYQITSSNSRQQVAMLNSTKYWNYIEAGPSNNSAYATIPTVSAIYTTINSSSPSSITQKTSSSSTISSQAANSSSTLSTVNPKSGSNFELIGISVVAVIIAGSAIGLILRRKHQGSLKTLG
ncbi:MAG: hypothetical protein ACHQ1H_00125 [Nitrososphaerales archaeon]